MSEILLNQGAEGKIYIGTFLDKKCIIKERFEKKYRVPELDKKLTKGRMINESRNIARCSNLGLLVPTIYFVDLLNRKIYMEYIENSAPLKDIINLIYHEKKEDVNIYGNLINKIINELGNFISIMHSNEIIHGDLTPSNILLQIDNENNENESGKNLILKNNNFDRLFLIDFGLSNISNNSNTSIEDKAVDLYVLKRAFISSAPKSEIMFNEIIKIYEQKCKFGEKIVQHYKKVEMRGRKKITFG